MARPKTCRGMLNQISRFLRDDSQVLKGERKKLWEVLTALRGPDYGESYNTKRATTAVIRYHALGSSAVRGFAQVRPDDEYSVRTRCEMKGRHFIDHAILAFDALGLKWCEHNGPYTDPLEKEE